MVPEVLEHLGLTSFRRKNSTSYLESLIISVSWFCGFDTVISIRIFDFS